MLQGILTGNVGNDPEQRYSANGNAFLRFNVASNYRTKTENGDWVDAVEWVRCTLFGARAESLGQYIVKGTRVTVVGVMESRPWTDREGNVRAGLEIRVSEIDFSTPKQSDGGGGYRRENDRDGYTQPPQQRQQNGYSGGGGGGGQQRQAQQRTATTTQDDDDDLEGLPF